MKILHSGYQVESVAPGTLEATGEGVQRFRNDRLGMSVHWGLYSLLGLNEWSYFKERFTWEKYHALTARFRPDRFHAEEWADLVLETGAKFLMVTTKHHDGFCLWDTDLTDFKTTNTPAKVDVIAQLAPALRDRGIGLHLYYSLLDWTHPTYRKDWPAYVAYYQGQLRELLTRYGTIGGVLFDGYWPRNFFEIEKDEPEYFAPRGAFDLTGTYDLIHRLQPAAMVVNNHHVLPLSGEDYQISELDMPGRNHTGFNCTQVGTKPTAVWWNVNLNWGYQPASHEVKPLEELLHVTRRARHMGATTILNIAPRPWGDIHPDEAAVLRQIGQYGRRLHLA